MLTRRAFTAASLARVVSANDKIRFGVIGAGGISRADIKAFLLNQGTECVAICDVDDKQLAKRLESLNTDHGIKPETTKDYRRILDRKDIDVVVVCTPDHWHALCAIHACQAGKDVYCEKPLSTSIVEGRAMIEAVRQNKRVLQMGTQWRSGAHYKEAIDYVHSGKLGKVRQVRVWAYLEWVKGAGNPPDGPVPEGVDYDMWLGPAP
jgi:predicted dehydrogenase